MPLLAMDAAEADERHGGSEKQRVIVSCCEMQMERSKPCLRDKIP